MMKINNINIVLTGEFTEFGHALDEGTCEKAITSFSM
jgi:hypothetical protein